MRRVFAIVVVCVVAVAVAWWVSGLSGQIAATVGGLTIETSTPVAVLGLAILVVALMLVIRLLLWLVTMPLRIGRWRARQRRQSGDLSISRALVAIAAGDEAESRRETTRARRLLGDTPQTLLLAAEAERLGGDEAAATELYKSLAARDDAAFLGLRGLFRQAMAREDWAEAALYARRAEIVRPGAAWLREERTSLAVRTENWGQALLLAPNGAPLADYATAAAEAEPDPREALRLAKQVWKDNQGFVPAAMAYARRLRAISREGRVQDVIRTTWGLSPTPEMAVFLLAPITDKMARVKEAMRLLQANLRSPESHMVVSRAHLEAGLTGEARRHANEALRLGLNEQRVWLLLAEIESLEASDTETGRAAQAEAFRRATTAAPDSAWHCETCGTVHTMWHAACPACHTSGRVRWGSPVRLLALPAA